MKKDFYINWLNNSISEGHIKYYEYSDFKNVQQIGRGSHANVLRVNLKNSDRIFALKSFNNDEQALETLVKKLNLHREVDDHENIIRLCGITKEKGDPVFQINKYSLVLEYADGGTLNSYLSNHFNELDWNDKFQLAFQLASAVEFMHDSDIIHRDLHANNILVHKRTIKLTGFGLSKKITDEFSNTTKIIGVIPYIDPKSFDNQSYILNKKSDVYSIGALIWQISSGYEPFKGRDYDVSLVIAIYNGLREEIIDGTPPEYSNLYTECWKYEPNERPNMKEVVYTLKEFLNQNTNVYERKYESSISIDDLDSNILPLQFDNVNEKKRNYSLKKYESISELSKETMDLKCDYSDSMSMIFEGTNSLLDTEQATTSLIDAHIYEDNSLLKHEFTTPDEKVKELIKELTEIRFLYDLKLLFENLQNTFSSQVLINSLKALSDPTLFDHYSKEIVSRLELHLRTLVAVLEQIHFSPIVLSKDLQDKVYNSLTKFAEIYYKTIQVIDNNENSKNVIKRRNYNIDFLLIHLRDTLHNLWDDKIWFKELLQRVRDLLKNTLNITSSSPNDNCSTLPMFDQLSQELNFKYTVASYHVDWRIILIIRYNLFNWSESSEKIISKKFGEMILMEYFWSYLEREWINNNNAMLSFQTKFDEVSNKLAKALRNTGSFLNNLTGNEHLVLPDTLWFGILDFAQNLIQKSTQTATHGLCYYLAIESLNKAPSSFIQFKAIEILLHLYNINNELFAIIELDLDQYAEKLNKNSLTKESSENFQNLLLFVKEKFLEDFNILHKIRKGKKVNKDTSFKKVNSFDILDVIADEITCPISNEPTDQLYILKCQHLISLSSIKKLRQKKCPKCREKIEDNGITYLPQNTIYKNLYSSFFEAGHILPSIELEDFYNQYVSDSDNSEADLILTKKCIKKSNNLVKSQLLASIKEKLKKKFGIKKNCPEAESPSQTSIKEKFKIKFGFKKKVLEAELPSQMVETVESPSQMVETVEPSSQMVETVELPSETVELSSQMVKTVELPSETVKPSSQMVETVESSSQTWIKNSIQEKLIKHIEWNELTDQSIVGSGYFGVVFKANWSKTKNYVVCKKLTTFDNIQFWNSFQHEIQIQIRAHACENIVRFLGITQEPQSNCCIVMEYADDGDLQTYLAKNFSSFDWDKKYQLAFDITNGIHYLHGENILHRDLHAKNIVIQKGKAKITDFGTAKSLETQTKIHKEVFGVAPYMAPELFNHSNNPQPPPFSKKTDIYSLGVLLWMLSSGYPPFKNQMTIGIILNIINGTREQKISNTPPDYYKLYTACWSGNPEERPIIEYIYDKLENMLPNGNGITEDQQVVIEDTEGPVINQYSESIVVNFLGT